MFIYADSRELFTNSHQLIHVEFTANYCMFELRQIQS